VKDVRIVRMRGLSVCWLRAWELVYRCSKIRFWGDGREEDARIVRMWVWVFVG
jgi:hypothetical protein